MNCETARSSQAWASIASSANWRRGELVIQFSLQGVAAVRAKAVGRVEGHSAVRAKAHSVSGGRQLHHRFLHLHHRCALYDRWFVVPRRWSRWSEDSVVDTRARHAGTRAIGRRRATRRLSGERTRFFDPERARIEPGDRWRNRPRHARPCRWIGHGDLEATESGV